MWRSRSGSKVCEKFATSFGSPPARQHNKPVNFGQPRQAVLNFICSLSLGASRALTTAYEQFRFAGTWRANECGEATSSHCHAVKHKGGLSQGKSVEIDDARRNIVLAWIVSTAEGSDRQTGL